MVVTEGGFGLRNSKVKLPTRILTAKTWELEQSCLKEDGNGLQEIVSDGVLVIDSGAGYVNPQVRISLTRFASTHTRCASGAYLGNPDGDVYMVKVGDLNGSSGAKVVFSNNETTHQ